MRNGVYHCPVDALLLKLPEREFYSLGYSIWESQQESRRQAIAETDAKWVKALEEGRVKKVRPNQRLGRRGGWKILDDWELKRNAA
jgi:hypothetical protein